MVQEFPFVGPMTKAYTLQEDRQSCGEMIQVFNKYVHLTRLATRLALVFSDTDFNYLRVLLEDRHLCGDMIQVFK